MTLLQSILLSQHKVFRCASNLAEVECVATLVTQHLLSFASDKVCIIINDATLTMQINVALNTRDIRDIAICSSSDVLLDAFDLYIVAGCTIEKFISAACKDLNSREERLEREGQLMSDFQNLIVQKTVFFTHGNQHPIHYLNLLPNEEIYVSHQHQQPSTAPTITVPRERMPKKISVTAIEKLMRDPYSYYIHHILGLNALKTEEEMLEQHFGIMLHDVLSAVINIDPNISQSEYTAQFMNIYQDIIARRNLTSHIVQALWPERMHNICTWFQSYEKQASLHRAEVLTEQDWSMQFAYGEDQVIEVTARIDRIDVMQDGSIKIIDYKSGYLPSNKDIASGLSPQLPIEALIVAYGSSSCGKKLETKQGAGSLIYISLHGKNEIGTTHKIDVNLLDTRTGLKLLFNRFWNNEEFFANDALVATFATDEYRHCLR